MGTTLNPKRKLCIVKTNGPIVEMGNINGPVLTPCRINLDVLARMVGNGKVIYEINPKNQDEQVKLTVHNVLSDNFATKEEIMQKAAEQSVTVSNQTEQSSASEAKEDVKTDPTTVNVVDKETNTTVQVGKNKKSDFNKSK